MRAGAPRIVFLVACLVSLGTWFIALPLYGQPENLEDWRAFESPSFTLYSDADSPRCAEILVGLERFRAVFAQLAPDLVLDSPAPTRILAFRGRESYGPYKTVSEERGTRILGQFLSHRDGNFITLDASSRMTGALGPIYHEYVHFFIRNSFSRVPLWLHEGLAEYYSTFATDGERAWVGLPVERHVRWLGQNTDLRLRDVLELTNGEHGSVSGKIDVGRFYAVSWALVHYLMSGSEERLTQMAELLVALDEGVEPDRAFARAFNASPDRVEERLQAYLAGGRLPAASVPLDALGGVIEPRERAAGSGAVLVQLGGLLAIEGRPAEAEVHYELALDLSGGETRSAAGDALAGIAQLRDLESRHGEADVLYREAVALEPAEARSWLWYGRHLMSPAEAESGEIPAESLDLARWALGRAVDLDPGYAEARALLGFTYLFGDEEPEPGIHQLERARRGLPARMDLVFYLVQLHLRNGDFGRAGELVDQVLEPRADPELTQRAREEVERTELLAAMDVALAEGRIDEGLELLDRAIDLTTDEARRHVLETRLDALRRHYRL